ncbi:hypothetical protein K7X08_016713 [Anisodus acutangulus]|uniref:Uncharacterized protein n=1 Tax=Anisodus acutangulus TaxID=402998 RepID=A0A9Q1LHU4_9SOLA|nr:hypothetical protein K7X08_016713 [Anisodus acutangulus]
MLLQWKSIGSRISTNISSALTYQLGITMQYSRACGALANDCRGSLIPSRMELVVENCTYAANIHILRSSQMAAVRVICDFGFFDREKKKRLKRSLNTPLKFSKTSWTH